MTKKKCEHAVNFPESTMVFIAGKGWRCSTCSAFNPRHDGDDCPAFKGGQGNTDEDVGDSAMVLVWTFACACVFAALITFLIWRANQ